MVKELIGEIDDDLVFVFVIEFAYFHQIDISDKRVSGVNVERL